MRFASRYSTRLCLACLLLAASGGCRRAAPAEPPITTIRMTTGINRIGFQPLGESLARVYDTKLPYVRVQVLESGGSVVNVEAIERGDAELGFVFADVAYMASIGRLAGHVEPFARVRGIAVLQLTPVHLLVRPGAHIRRIADLRGRVVGVGSAGSGTALTAGLVAGAFGLTDREFRPEPVSFSESLERMRNGRQDAVFVNALYPADIVRAAIDSGVAELIPISGPAIDRLRHSYPFLRVARFPARSYPRQQTSIQTVGIDSLIVCRSDLDESLVYDLTRTFFEALPALSGSHEMLRTMDLEQAPATPIPLHEGAARYYRERELLR